MNFFKSVFADDPDPSGTESESDSPKHTDQVHENPDQSNPNNNEEYEDDGGWSFGGLMKTLATRSESVIETYRRDLEEFGTGLKKEIEVAQGSLGTMGHAIDELGNTVLKSTAEIIAQGKEAILAAGNESDSSDSNNNTTSIGRRDSFSSKPYSRFDAQVRFVQSDVNTYCEEPEDTDDYKKWESEFVLDEKVEEMERLFEENGDMKGVYKRVVPSVVDHESFWFRYFYKVHKVKQAEDLRANLVKRARSLEDEEELSWDIDDDEEGSNEKVIESTKEVSRLKLEGNDEARSADSVTEVSNVDTGSEKKTVVDSAPPVSDKAPIQDSGNPVVVPASEKTESQDSGKPEAVPESDKAATSQDSGKPVVESAPVQDSGKNEVVSSTQQQSSEEDLGWDEIEDMSSIDGGGGGKEVVAATRSGSGGSPDRAELRKRLSAATEEEDEDLSWDIEDDDDEEESSNKA